MAIDIASQIDQTLIVDAATANAADVTTPLGNFVTVWNNVLNGIQAAEAVLLYGLTTVPSSAPVGYAKLYVRSDSLKILSDSGAETTVATLDATSNDMIIGAQVFS